MELFMELISWILKSNFRLESWRGNETLIFYAMAEKNWLKLSGLLQNGNVGVIKLNFEKGF